MVSAGRLRASLAALRRTDPFLQELAAAAGDTGSRLLVVGGLIRDLRLGLPPRDADFILAGGGRKQFLRMLPVLSGARVVTFRKRGVVDHRVLVSGREPELVELSGADLAGELRRRDFTINSIAWDVSTGRLIDPQGGLRDASRRQLRANSPRVFRDDPLRMLRAVRLRAELPGFSL